MWKLNASLLVLALAIAPLPWAQSAAPAGSLPEGAMKAKATTACLECHDAGIIMQQRASKPAWTREVDKMTKWGALVDPNDREALIEYLSVNFGTDKPAEVPTRTTLGKSKKAR